MSADMPLYQGTKTIRAKPMTRGDYNELRGWTVPADEDPADDGYLVEYTDGGKPNVVGFDGYVSWSPADVFERTYEPCGAHIDRIAIELRELGARIKKLNHFMQTGDVYQGMSFDDQALLNTQQGAMLAYHGALSLRFMRETGQSASS